LLGVEVLYRVKGEMLLNECKREKERKEEKEKREEREREMHVVAERGNNRPPVPRYWILHQVEPY